MPEEEKLKGKPAVRDVVKLYEEVKEVPVSVTTAEPATPAPKPKKREQDK